jgi:hypothetical protein
MTAKLQKLSISGAVLERGFWLYVWEIHTGDGEAWYYIGRTGDSSSCHAQSPFARVSAHLGSNKNSNTLRGLLEGKGVRLESCRDLNLITYGPIYEETGDKQTHRNRRDKVAALEKALCDAMTTVGYSVVNHVNCLKAIDPGKWNEVRGAFVSHFPKLAN